MQPRTVSMPVVRSTANEKPERLADHLAPPSSSTSTSSLEPAAPPTKKPTKRRAKAPRRDAAVPTEELRQPVAMVTDVGGAPPRPYRGKCLYQSRKCENERALKRNGQPHNLCEEHRAKQNQHQRKFDAKKFSRKRRPDQEGDEEDEEGGGGGETLEDDTSDSPAAPVVVKPSPRHVVKRQRVQSPHGSLVLPPHAPSPAASLPLVPPALPSQRAGYDARPPQLMIQHSAYMPYNPIDARLVHPPQAHPPPSPYTMYRGPVLAAYSVSELEAARILVPTPATTASPAAYRDPRCGGPPQAYPPQPLHPRPVVASPYHADPYARHEDAPGPVLPPLLPLRPTATPTENSRRPRSLSCNSNSPTLPPPPPAIPRLASLSAVRTTPVANVLPPIRRQSPPLRPASNQQ